MRESGTFERLSVYTEHPIDFDDFPNKYGTAVMVSMYAKCTIPHHHAEQVGAVCKPPLSPPKRANTQTTHIQFQVQSKKSVLVMSLMLRAHFPCSYWLTHYVATGLTLSRCKVSAAHPVTL